jgi:nitroreductase
MRIEAIVPRPVRRLFRRPVYLARGLREYLYDFRLFSAASSAVNTEWTAATLGAVIVKEYHRLEKGLALPEPRRGFGSSTVHELFRLVQQHEALFGEAPATREARSALYHYRISPHCLPDLGAEIDAFLSTTSIDDLPPAGAMTVSRDEIHRAAQIDFADFARHRFSARVFTGDPVPPAAIEQAVAVAMKSPRVCNRGTTRCYAAFSPEVRARALALQNGNAGFGHLAGAVLVITSSRAGFTDWGERNQCWIDGGLFAMSLCYALHAAGFGTCMLNWSTLAARDKSLHDALDIPADEAVITLMAVGVLPPSLKVAISPREPVEQVFRNLDERLLSAAPSRVPTGRRR